MLACLHIVVANGNHNENRFIREKVFEEQTVCAFVECCLPTEFYNFGDEFTINIYLHHYLFQIPKNPAN